jgi:sigma-E factor negative regulatory protein RseB
MNTSLFMLKRRLAQVNAGLFAPLFVAICALVMGSSLPLRATAQTPTTLPSAPVPTGDGAISINEWLTRMHEASMKRRSYIGTLVQTSQGTMSSARIWHTCDGQTQIERIESLTGVPRSSIRQDDKLVTFLPEQRVARVEKREGLVLASGLTELFKPGASHIPDFYTVKALGSERIAGLDAEVVQLNPRDSLRYGYRIWTERKSALVLKLQTLDANGTVIEQAAFSELQLDAPVKAAKLKQMMKPAEGWRVEQTEVVKTTAAAEGWQLKSTVPGFKAVSCHKRGSAQNADGTMQWVFSDGLATVSLFVEAFDKSRHTQEGVVSTGATQSLFRRMNDYFLTAVGEVPPQTLKSFAAALSRSTDGKK